MRPGEYQSDSFTRKEQVCRSFRLDYHTMPLWIQIVLATLIGLFILFLILELPPQHRFIDAAGKKDSAKLKKWLDAGRDPNKPGMFGLTALGSAVLEGANENIKLLLERGADPNLACTKFQPLQHAIEHGNIEAVRILLDHGADFNKPGLFGVSALQEAATSGRMDILDLFVKRGADLNVVSSHGDPLLFTLLTTLVGTKKESERAELRKTVQFFLTHGVNPNVRSKEDTPVIFVALEDAPTLRLLVDGGAITKVSYAGLELQSLINDALSSESAMERIPERQ